MSGTNHKLCENEAGNSTINLGTCKNYIFFRGKSTKYSSEQVECSFDNFAGMRSDERPQIFTSMSKNDENNVFFSRKQLLLRSLLWARRVRIRQPAGSFQTECLNVLAQCSESREIYQGKNPKLLASNKKYLQNFSLKMFLWTQKNILHNPS